MLSAARERNVRVPGELAVLGFDDLDFAQFIGLSTISQSLEMSGKQAVELLLAAMADPQPLTRHVQAPLRLVQRNTTSILSSFKPVCERVQRSLKLVGCHPGQQIAGMELT